MTSRTIYDVFTSIFIHFLPSCTSAWSLSAFASWVDLPKARLSRLASSLHTPHRRPTDQYPTSHQINAVDAGIPAQMHAHTRSKPIAHILFPSTKKTRTTYTDRERGRHAMLQHCNTTAKTTTHQLIPRQTPTHPCPVPSITCERPSHTLMADSLDFPLLRY